MPILMNGEYNFYTSIFKPLMDFVFSLGLLLMLLPIGSLFSIALAIQFKGNPFYAQRRIGMKGSAFYLLKFRSYCVDGEESSMPRIGVFIRKTSINELPQLVNILLGNMSFVGPRPLLPEYLTFYNKIEQRRHDVKPGLSGLSQIEIGNTSNWTARLEKDVEYVERQSFVLDLEILLKTVVKVILRKRIDDVTIQRFDDFARNR